MKILLALILTLLLFGCGAIKTKQFNSEAELLKLECDRDLQDASFDVIRDKVLLERGKMPTFEMLANTNYPSQDEKLAIKEFAIKKMGCDNKFTNSIKKLGNYQFVTIWQSYNSILDGLNAQLYNKQLTYSQYNNESAKIINEATTAMQNADSKAQEANAAYAQRAYQNYMLHLQTYKPNRGFVCNTVGNFSYCN